MSIGRETLTILQMAVPYFLVHLYCIRAKCTGEEIPFRMKLVCDLLCTVIAVYSVYVAFFAKW